MIRSSVILFLFTVCTGAHALCTSKKIESQLNSGGWTYEYLESQSEKGEINTYRIVKDGSVFSLHVESDGDTGFRKYYSDEMLLNAINKVNTSLKYITVYRDSDNDLAMSYDIAKFDEKCPKNLSEHIKLFARATERAVIALSE